MTETTSDYSPPSHWRRIRTIDMHTGGEPLRVILDGLPPLLGNNVLEYRRYFQAKHDDLRRALMFEPRGHADMYGCILLPPNDPGAHFGILFLHNEGYSTMCGHAVLAIARLAVELGWVARREPVTEVRLDAPCGRIAAFARMEAGRVTGAWFHGVPSFVVGLDQEMEVPGWGRLRYDLAYGGAFYAYVDTAPLGLSLTPADYQRLIRAGRDIKRAVMAADLRILHPFEADLSFLYGVIFTDASPTDGVDKRNVCVFADGEVDRSPTGSGVMGRLAIDFARRTLKTGEPLRVESITGSVFTGSVVEETDYGPFRAIIPQVEGMAYLTGRHEFWIDPEDPFGQGFFLR